MIATGAAISDPTRLLMLFVLGAGPLPVGQLARRTHITSSSATYHVHLLRRAGLDGVQRVGRRALVRRIERRWAAELGAFATAEESARPHRHHRRGPLHGLERGCPPIAGQVAEDGEQCLGGDDFG